MLKRLVLFGIIIQVIFSGISFGSSELRYGGYPLATTSAYEDNKIEVEFGVPIETFSSTAFEVYEWDDEDAQRPVREYVPTEDSVEIRVTSLKAGKLYVLDSKYLRVDGVYKNSYKQLFRVNNKGGGYGVSIIGGTVLNDKAFEIYFNQPVAPTSNLLNHILLYDNNELISGEGVNIISVIRTAAPKTRVLCKLVGVSKFEVGHEYRIEILEGFESDYGTEVSDSDVEFYMYRFSELETVHTGVEIERLTEGVLKCVFEQEMTSNVAPLIQATQNEALPVESFEWFLDKNERQKVLILHMMNKVELDKQLLISGVSNLYTGDKITLLGRVTELDNPIQVESVSIKDPATFKIKFNRPLTNSGVKNLKVMFERSNAIAVKAVDPSNPYVLHVGLSSRKSIHRDTDYLIQIAGTVEDAYGVSYAADALVEVHTDAVERFNFTVDTAYFMDETNIFLKLSHPISTDTSIKEKLKVVQDNSDTKQRIGIEEVEILDPFTVRVKLVKESNMFDVVVKADEINDASGRFELEGIYQVLGPWD